MDERTILVRPTEADIQRFDYSLLNTLYKAVAAEPAERPQDAATFAEEVLSARDVSVVDHGEDLVNPTVDDLRGLYRRSSLGNAGNRGLDDPFAHDTYRPTQLDTVLVPAIRDGELDVVVLSGNPGDGKTSFLANLAHELDKVGAITIKESPAGWRRRLDGPTFVAVYDASESHETRSSDDLLHLALAPATDDDPTRTVLIAANDGASPSSSASTPPAIRRSRPSCSASAPRPPSRVPASCSWISTPSPGLARPR